MKKKFLLKIIIFVSVTIIAFIGIVLYSENFHKLDMIENMKNVFKHNESIDSNNDNTVVDITGIQIGSETQHEHVYKTVYDKNKHWEECIICFDKRNEEVHIITTTWALGYESCENNNSYKEVCTCGYSSIGHKPCVWNGTAYRGIYEARSHVKTCSVCNKDIYYGYYYNNILYNEGEKENTVFFRFSYG